MYYVSQKNMICYLNVIYHIYFSGLRFVTSWNFNLYKEVSDWGRETLGDLHFKVDVKVIVIMKQSIKFTTSIIMEKFM